MGRPPPEPEGCVSARNKRNSKVPGRGWIQEGRGRWGGEEKDAQEVAIYYEGRNDYTNEETILLCSGCACNWT